MQAKRFQHSLLHHSFLLAAALFLASALCAQDKSLYEKHWLIRGTDTLPYRLLLPKNYNAQKKYPLLLFLHGSGERGRDNEAQLVHGWKLFLQDSIRDRYPAIVVFPQCPASSFWSNVDISYDTVAKKRIWNFPTNGAPSLGMQLLLELMKELPQQYKLDKKRIYVGGLSMGGMGTFELVRRMPKTFAAAWPICGGANPQTARQLKKPKWWIIHGLADDVVPPELSKNMADALVNAGATIRLNLYPGVNHNSWDKAFAEPDLMRWLFSNHK